MPKPRTSREDIDEYIATLVAGKKLLDVGCVDHSARKEAQAGWLHRRLTESAASILGLDILADDVQRLAAKGYHVVCGDAMTVDLGDRFDVIVAGEIIEHVASAGQFVANMRRHLKPEGMLILTTPNPFYAVHFGEFMVSANEGRWNEEHVGWFCAFTLKNLLARCGMRLDQCTYFTRSRRLRKVLRVLHLPCPRILASTVLIIGKPARGETAAVGAEAACA